MAVVLDVHCRFYDKTRTLPCHREFAGTLPGSGATSLTVHALCRYGKSRRWHSRHQFADGPSWRDPERKNSIKVKFMGQSLDRGVILVALNDRISSVRAWLVRVSQARIAGRCPPRRLSAREAPAAPALPGDGRAVVPVRRAAQPRQFPGGDDRPERGAGDQVAESTDANRARDDAVRMWSVIRRSLQARSRKTSRLVRAAPCY
jgi:hypothetical protein